jgi:protein-L-isoaspartate O-methyltransferase
LSDNLALWTGLEAGGAPLMWERVVQDIIPTMKSLMPPGSRVFEIGYGDGLLTCYLSRELGWHVVGLEVDRKAQQTAERHAREYGLRDRLDFRCGDPGDSYHQHGKFDAVFSKTVLYHAATPEEYGHWLDRIIPVLRPGGVFVNFETGRGNPLTQFYRRLRRRSYADLCLYNSSIEALYEARFEIIDRRYYGGWSQFLAPIPWLYLVAYRVEGTLRHRHADNCFIASIIARCKS